MITIAILSKDNAETIKNTLESTKDFAEVILLDNGSSDDTLQIAASFPNVTIYEHPFIGFGPLRNHAASLATNDWILALDSDEVLSPALVKEIFHTPLSPNTVYSIPFENYLNQKKIRFSGWSPDRHVRLYNKKVTSFSSAQVHEGVIVKNCVEYQLHNPIYHYSYRSIADFLRKMETYSTLFALQNRGKKKASLPTALLHGGFAFFKTYIIKRGFLDGSEGFIISLYNAHTAYYKYLKLMEANKCSSSSSTTA